MQFSAQQTKDSLNGALRRAQAGLKTLRRSDLPHAARNFTKLLNGAALPGVFGKFGLPLPGAGQQGASAEIVPQDHIKIPLGKEACHADCKAAYDRGQFLARQDRWSDLLDEIAAADKTRELLSDGGPLAEALAMGARCDVVKTLEHALRDGAPVDARITLDGIMELERLRLEMHRTPLMSTVVALAHIDGGNAFLTAADAVEAAQGGADASRAFPPDASSAEQRQSLKRRGKAHFERAAALLDHAELSSDNSLLLQAARCALYIGQDAPTQTVADDFAQLIDMAPLNPSHMRALGNHMLPRWHGSYTALDTEARRTAARQQSLWGAAGYTWVYLDALALDPGAFEQLDVDLFLDGLADIVEQDADLEAPTMVDQQLVNQLAAYCLLALKPKTEQPDDAEDAETQAAARPPQDKEVQDRETRDKETQARAEITEAAQWLVRNHMTELHPEIWAQAAHGADGGPQGAATRRLVESGKQQALAALAELFRAEISAGHQVAFTPGGPELMSAAPITD